MKCSKSELNMLKTTLKIDFIKSYEWSEMNNMMIKLQDQFDLFGI